MKILERAKKAYHLLKERGQLKPVLLVLAAVFFLWFAVFGEQGLYQLHKSIHLKKDLKNQRVELKKKIEGLERIKKLLNNRIYLEHVIRQELGYVKPGEVVYQQMNP